VGFQATTAKWPKTALFWVHYAASSGNFLPTFRDNLSGPTGCPETSVRNYHSLRNTQQTQFFKWDRVSHEILARKFKMVKCQIRLI